MLIYRCALIIKYCMGDLLLVARAPSGPTKVARESLKRCLMCLACLQTSPFPQKKSGEESLLPIFSEERGTSVYLVSPLLRWEVFLRVLWFPPLLKNQLFKFQFDSQWKVKNHSANVLRYLFVHPLI